MYDDFDASVCFESLGVSITLRQIYHKVSWLS
jgi:hypothetical protein